MRIKPILAVCGAALLAAAPAVPASAGTLQVNPVLLEINAGRRTATVTLRNQEAVPVTIRAYPLAWRQDGGDERYDETSAVIVSPPIFTIAPGATQLVRVGQRTPSAAPHAYRLIIEEVPEASPIDGIRVALRLNLPLYSHLAAGEAGALRWTSWQEPDGSWTLEAANRGTGYVRVNHDAAQAATGLRLGDHFSFGTVLPGAVRHWPIGARLDVSDPVTFRRVARTQDRVGAQASRD